MKQLLLILLLFSLKASAQWKEDGTVQTWPATIYLKDSVTGNQTGAIQGYVKAFRSWYYLNGVIDKSKGPDWSNIKSVMDQNHTANNNR